MNLISASKGRHLFEGYGSESTWKKFVVMVTGVKVRLESVRGPPFQYPLELPLEEGSSERRLALLPDIQDDEAATEIFRRLREAGATEAWVSHTLPFLVFIAIGYLLTLVVGDLALYVLSRLLF